MQDKDPKNAVSLIYDVLKKEYEAEEARNKHLETKVQMMLALSGIIVSAIILLLKIAVDVEGSGFRTINAAVFTIIIFLVIYAIYLLLSALKIKTFEKIEDEVIAGLNGTALTEEEVMIELIQDYRKSIKVSEEVLKSKIVAIKEGSNVLEVTIVLFGLTSLFVLWCKYFER